MCKWWIRDSRQQNLVRVGCGWCKQCCLLKIHSLCHVSRHRRRRRQRFVSRPKENSAFWFYWICICLIIYFSVVLIVYFIIYFIHLCIEFSDKWTVSTFSRLKSILLAAKHNDNTNVCVALIVARNAESCQCTSKLLARMKKSERFHCSAYQSLPHTPTSYRVARAVLNLNKFFIKYALKCVCFDSRIFVRHANVRCCALLETRAKCERFIRYWTLIDPSENINMVLFDWPFVCLFWLDFSLRSSHIFYLNIGNVMLVVRLCDFSMFLTL